MRTLTRAVADVDTGGQVIPVPLRAMSELQVGIRSSEVSMIAGVPGAGKSSLALYVAVMSGTPTLYVCADTSAWTMVLRLTAMLTGLTQDNVEAKIKAEGEQWAQQAMSQGAGHIHWVFDSAPSLDDIDAELQAYEEVMGSPPGLVVIDNLIDVTDGAGDEWAAMRSVMKEVKFLARDTGAAVLLLHHTSEAYSYAVCPPRASLQGKVAQLPALILTVHSEHGHMQIAAVKNRYGMADPSGATARPVWFAPDTMQINDVGR